VTAEALLSRRGASAEAAAPTIAAKAADTAKEHVLRCNRTIWISPENVQPAIDLMMRTANSRKRTRRIEVTV